MSYLGKGNFPNASDINAKFVENVEPDLVPDLIQHLQMELGRVLAPQNSRDRMHSLHIESLIRITRAKQFAITTIKNAQ